MTDAQVQWACSDASQTVNVVELSGVCEMSLADLDALMDYGALLPVDPAQSEIQFRAACIAPLRTAAKLRRDFDLDIFAVAFLLDYLNRIDALETQVRALEAGLSWPPTPVQ